MSFGCCPGGGGMDYKYQFTRMSKADADHASRLAVLYPLSPVPAGLSGDAYEDAVREAMAALLVQWRARLAVLHQAGMPALEGLQRLCYARNCCPAGMTAVQTP